MVEHYIEVRHLLKSYGDCLENGTTDSFGQKKAVQLLETTFAPCTKKLNLTRK